MKTKRFTSTTAKLPANEMILGGDASPRMFAKRSVQQTETDYQNWKKNNGKK